MNLTITINETGNAILGTMVRATAPEGELWGAWVSGPTHMGALKAARKAILAHPEVRVTEVIYQIKGVTI